MGTTESATTETRYSVPECNLEALLERIEKLNKRCRRLRIPEIDVRCEEAYTAHQYTGSDGPYWVPEKNLSDAPAAQAATGRVMVWWEVAVTGTTPKYAGWTFVASLEPLALEGQDTVNLIMTVPGTTCPGEYMRPEYVGVCDHCRTRRRRKQTFVVRHENGDYKAVGRTCLKDFLGHKDPNCLASWAELIIELNSIGTGSESEGWMGGGHVADPQYDLEYYLGWVAGVVRTHGWVSRTRAYNESDAWATVDRVNYILDPPPFTGPYAAKEKAEWEKMRTETTPTEADSTEAAEALEWALGLDIDALMETNNNYLANLGALARAQRVNSTTCGLGGSIMIAYAKTRARAAKTPRLDSCHVGTPRERGTYRVRVGRIIPSEGMYGLVLITRMTAWDDERGAYANDMVWFCTGDSDLEEGCEYEIKATVKAHGDYKGRPQTTVNRVKTVAELAAT